MTQNRTTIQILKSITLPLFAKLRSVKWHFLSFVFKFFVPNLFLSQNPSNKPCCISICYIKSVVYQEEDNDDLLESILRYNKDMHDDTTKLYL